MSQSYARTKNDFETIKSEKIAELLIKRFGIAESAFNGYCFFRKARSIWVMSNAILPKLRYETLGIRMMNLKDCPWKPTTAALQIFGKFASKNVVKLDLQQTRSFLAGESLLIYIDVEPGYVVVVHRDEVLGCGLYSFGKLISQIPKDRRMIKDACPEGSS